MTHKIKAPGVDHFIYLITLYFITFTTDLTAQIIRSGAASPRIISRNVSTEMPGFYGSIYVEKKGFSLRSEDLISNNNGKTWSKSPMKPDFTLGLPGGYRRNPVTSVLDPNTGRIITIVNAIDIKDLDPTIGEPPVAQKTYYLRYRVSKDSGKTWLFDDPIIQVGKFTAHHPLPGVFIGKNSIDLGDRGCIPIVTKKGKVLVPAQATLLGKDGELWNPGGGYTYTDVMVLIGTWKGNKLSWKASARVEADPKRSTRGMIEPTLTELKDGRILMVMRGSNGGRLDPQNLLPSYKWYAISKDGGETWSKPQPWCFGDGTTFYSPSSMSTLFRHSDGRCFWVGNMTETNSNGNLPRWPLVFAEVDTKNLKLIRNSLLIVDTYQPEDSSRRRLDISHISLIEDRKTKEIILTYPRSYNAYKSREWVTTRIAIE
jgi:hypothetical protein